MLEWLGNSKQSEVASEAKTADFGDGCWASAVLSGSGYKPVQMTMPNVNKKR